VTLGSLLLALSGLACVAGAAQGQLIHLDRERPRVAVFLEEDDAGQSTTLLTSFLLEAGFDVISPDFARSVAGDAWAERIVDGPQAEATELGRRLGAHVILVGAADTEVGTNPIDEDLKVATSAVHLRAVRLDQPRLVASASTTAQGVGATGLGARTEATRTAIDALIEQTTFMGELSIDWRERPWDDDAYWREPGAGDASAAAADRAAILETVTVGERAARSGIAPPGAVELSAHVRGATLAPPRQVVVGGTPATVRTPTDDERRRFALAPGAFLFEADVPIAGSQDTLRARVDFDSGTTDLVFTPGTGERWAVVMGVSRYRDPRIRALQYADDDARAIADFLRSPAGGAISDERMRVLIDEAATMTAFRDAMSVFLQRAAPNDEVVIYVAAHGAPDPERPANLYILPYDADPDRFAATAFPMWDFKTATRRHIVAERVVVFADACRAAGAFDSATPNPIGAAFDELFASSRRVTLSASGVDELSEEGAEWGGGHGVFTHFLLEALGGQADADEDGNVGFAEAAGYVRARVAEATAGRQNPRRAGMGDVGLTTPATTTHH
jgi:hypothetical protein